MAAILERLAATWHLMRIVRLGIGMMLLIMGIQSRDWMMGTFSLFFLYQAFTNTGCCGTESCSADGCNTPGHRHYNHITTEEKTVEYEEIK